MTTISTCLVCVCGVLMTRVLVLHQNRPVRSMTRTTGAHISERLLPRHVHLVVWGHEHECRIGV
jgi:hypothetical protein